jgi:TBC1 domain family member 15
MKDMLLTYNEYNRDLGYVQGMSDLLAPIYAVMQDDAIAFWGFAHFMERMERNFLRDQSGMRAQLLTFDHLVQLMDPKLYLHLQSADSTNFFFFFRMLLVWYKREFPWMDILHLWEVLWTDYLSSGFHLFIALAILEKHRSVIMDHLKHFDEVLKYGKHSPRLNMEKIDTNDVTVNELANTIDLESTLIRAEALFHRFQRTVEAIDKKQNFPAPKLRQRPVQSASLGATQSPTSTSAVEGASGTRTGANVTSGDPNSPDTTKGKRRVSGEELQETQPVRKVISPELRKLLSRKVEVLPRKVVQKKGEGLDRKRG